MSGAVTSRFGAEPASSGGTRLNSKFIIEKSIHWFWTESLSGPEAQCRSLSDFSDLDSDRDDHGVPLNSHQPPDDLTGLSFQKIVRSDAYALCICSIHISYAIWE
jgi:hypothetical protein